MTPALRKRHLRMWIVLAFLLPVGFISAFLEKPLPVRDQAPGPRLAEAFETIDRSAEDDDIKANLRSEVISVEADSITAEASRYQVEIILKQPLTSPSTQVYLGLEEGNESVENKLLLGNLGPRGIYRFELKDLPEVPEKLFLIFHDGIKEATTKTLTL